MPITEAQRRGKLTQVGRQVGHIVRTAANNLTAEFHARPTVYVALNELPSTTGEHSAGGGLVRARAVTWLQAFNAASGLLAIPMLHPHAASAGGWPGGSVWPDNSYRTFWKEVDATCKYVGLERYFTYDDVIHQSTPTLNTLFLGLFDVLWAHFKSGEGIYHHNIAANKLIAVPSLRYSPGSNAYGGTDSNHHTLAQHFAFMDRPQSYAAAPAE
jgi:hypothetical protein